MSWGKIDPDNLPACVVCYLDSTISLPLITTYALTKLAPASAKTSAPAATNNSPPSRRSISVRIVKDYTQDYKTPDITEVEIREIGDISLNGFPLRQLVRMKLDQVLAPSI